MRFRALRSDPTGGVAIEYAVIGALIGIGLIGSLVGTKGSLSAIFGTASSAMGSANTGASPGNPVTSQRPVAQASTSSRYAYWSGKTLSSKTVTNPTPNSQLTTFSYADGSSGSYLAQYDNSGVLTGEVVTTYPFNWPTTSRTMDSFQVTYGADGSQLSGSYIDRYANGTVKETATSAASNNWYETVTYFNTDGTVSSTFSLYDNTVPPGLARAAGDEVYFRALANQ